MAPQFTGTNGLPARRLFWCTYLAMTSLPVPVSPVSSTVLSEGAMRLQVEIISNSGDLGAQMTPAGSSTFVWVVMMFLVRATLAPRPWRQTYTRGVGNLSGRYRFGEPK